MGSLGTHRYPDADIVTLDPRFASNALATRR
jgi:hypothetical protein